MFFNTAVLPGFPACQDGLFEPAQLSGDLREFRRSLSASPKRKSMEFRSGTRSRRQEGVDPDLVSRVSRRSPAPGRRTSSRSGTGLQMLFRRGYISPWVPHQGFPLPPGNRRRGARTGRRNSPSPTHARPRGKDAAASRRCRSEYLEGWPNSGFFERALVACSGRPKRSGQEDMAMLVNMTGFRDPGRGRKVEEEGVNG